MRSIALTIVSLLSLLSAAPALAASVVAVPRADHPWEARGLRLSSRGTYQSPLDDYGRLYDYYYDGPQRTRSFALHPLTRNRYYNPRPFEILSDLGRFGGYFDTDVYKFDLRTGQWVLQTSQVAGSVSATIPCADYIYVRPNYKVPPFGYKCE